MYHPRLATTSDIDALVSILLSCFDDDPCYTYRFPNAHLHPRDYKEHCQRKCIEYLRTSTVVVCEANDNKVVGFGVWDEPIYRLFNDCSRAQTWPRPAGVDTTLNKGKTKSNCTAGNHITKQHALAAKQPLSPLYSRPDRSAAFLSASTAARIKYFDKPYTAGNYMFLKILMVQPSYRLRGVGTALVRWGTARAQVEGVNTALFSSPMGYGFYRKLGFSKIGRFEVRLGEEEQKLELPVMLLLPVVARRGSCCAAETVGVRVGLRRVVTAGAMVAQEI